MPIVVGRDIYKNLNVEFLIFNLATRALLVGFVAADGPAIFKLPA